MMGLSKIDLSNQFRFIRRAILGVQGRLITFIVLLFEITLIKLVPHNNCKHIWLIGENRGECLKENGYWFYQYVRNNHNNQTVFFVVKTVSPFYRKQLISDPFVIKYGSFKHAVIFAKATVCLYTHTYRDIMYRRSFELFGTHKRLIYLHHGVLGFKKFNNFYQKNKNIMDLFTVGSLLEKEILIKQECVDEQRIKVTGYARYDQVTNCSSDSQLQIVYIPTHRNYIKKKFVYSQFYEKIQSFLNNNNLLKTLELNNITLKVYLHKEMQHYSDLLDCHGSHVKVIRLGEETPRELISVSHLMITDYSSVSWDFFNLGKPIIFYRFDIDRYLKDRNSYINLYGDIIGDVVFDEQQLMVKIIEYVKNKFQMKKSHIIYRQKILPNFDNRNCERIYKEIITLE
ncbi:MAG: hypothetical protein GY941_08670 [Planctomycetes bacterium]|nr:hypothetical protein [Planctomycetota bacterium]